MEITSHKEDLLPVISNPLARPLGSIPKRIYQVFSIILNHASLSDLLFKLIFLFSEVVRNKDINLNIHLSTYKIFSLKRVSFTPWCSTIYSVKKKIQPNQKIWFVKIKWILLTFCFWLSFKKPDSFQFE